MAVETEEPVGADAPATTSQARWDASDVSIRLVVVMLVLTAVIAVLGWQYRSGARFGADGDDAAPPGG